MKTSTLKKPLGCLLFVIFLLVIIDCFTDVIKTNIIKKFDPTHKTRREVAEEEAKEEIKKQVKDAEEKARKEQPEIDLENLEASKDEKMLALVDEGKILRSLKKKNAELVIPPIKGFYVLDNFVWVCGILLVYDESSEKNYYCPAIVISEDGGNNYKLLKVFREFNTGFMHSKVFFSDKNVGYLEIFGAEYNKNLTRARIYKTTNGGHNWDLILDTTNFQFFGGCIQRIRSDDQKIILVTTLQGGGFFGLMQTDDGGKSWVYKQNGKDVAKTSDRGLTWIY